MELCDTTERKRRNKGSTREEKKKMQKVAPLGDNELIVCEILSRLPAKSLMRFKCVCKSWQSLIQRDQHFIDLHFNRSQTSSRNGTVGATSLLITVPSLWHGNIAKERCFLLAELQVPSETGNGGGGAAVVRRKIPLNSGEDTIFRYDLLNIINGLICLMDPVSHSTRVFNPSTTESTPWIKSIVRQRQKEEKGGVLDSYTVFGAAFGYDLATKDYKVVSFWKHSGDSFCEIFSLRNKSWRLIDAVPPVEAYILFLSDSVYANGCVYWLCADVKPAVVVEFNFATEKFRVISVPNSIIISSHGCNKTDIMELAGRLALSAKKDVRPDQSKREHEIPMEICILYDDDRDKTKKYSTSTTTDYHWMRESFAVPPFDRRSSYDTSIIPIPGTDLFIVRAYDNFSFYYYNWKKKSYSSKFKLKGTKPFFNKKSNNGERDYVEFFTFTENLMPLN